ncbi:NAD-dependent epimerase/dehydratase family protein [Streptomyces dysideae]|uniref:NAD-dependent epimerase/dehydratase domain-containing protein n=1 Tax=Streptomyces dysideae TaxID=909626 RepID=A0A101V1E4_9ACTN|nr:NAD(P)-dependent oxidoreductase [Streptomyces dysideae]KUO20683.1 hypothetical protein AQJ91_12190 [Streptomyces dysideae]
MILLTGASGFIGGRAASLLRGRLPDPAALRVLTHRRTAGIEAEYFAADLADPASLHGCCDGVETVVHLASAVEADAATCEAVNVRGTQALLAEARRAGVRRIIALSTAAVYGDGPYAGIAEDEVPLAPASPTSRSRAAAERAVLTAGGTVLRPMFVYGPGDMWFIPTLARALTRTPVTVNGGRARLSLISVEDLAKVIAALALSPAPPAASTRPRVLHVNHPEPVRVLELYELLAEHLDVPRPTGDLDYTDALAFAGPEKARQVGMVALDRHFDSTRVWRETGLTAGSLRDRFPACAPWYRQHLGARTVDR